MACGGDCGCNDCAGKTLAVGRAALASPRGQLEVHPEACGVCGGSHPTNEHRASARKRRMSGAWAAVAPSDEVTTHPTARRAAVAGRFPSGSDADADAVHPPQTVEPAGDGAPPAPSRPLPTRLAEPEGQGDPPSSGSESRPAAAGATASQPAGAAASSAGAFVRPDDFVFEGGRGKGGGKPKGKQFKKPNGMLPDGSGGDHFFFENVIQDPANGAFNLLAASLSAPLGLFRLGRAASSASSAVSANTAVVDTTVSVDTSTPDCECDCVSITPTTFDVAVSPGIGSGAANYLQPPLLFSALGAGSMRDQTRIAVAGSISSGVRSVGGGAAPVGSSTRSEGVTPSSAMGANLVGKPSGWVLASKGVSGAVAAPRIDYSAAGRRAADVTTGRRSASNLGRSGLADLASDADMDVGAGGIGGAAVARAVTGAPTASGASASSAGADAGIARAIGPNVATAGPQAGPPSGAGGGTDGSGSGGGGSGGGGGGPIADAGMGVGGGGGSGGGSGGGGGAGGNGGAQGGGAGSAPPPSSGVALRPSPSTSTPASTSKPAIGPPLHPIGSVANALRAPLLSPDGALGRRGQLGPSGSLAPGARGSSSWRATVAPFGDLGRADLGGRPTRGSVDAGGGFAASSRSVPGADGSIRAQASSATSLASDTRAVGDPAGFGGRAGASRLALTPDSAPRSEKLPLSPPQTSMGGTAVIAAYSSLPGGNAGAVTPLGFASGIPAGAKTSPDGVAVGRATDEALAGGTVGFGRRLAAPDATGGALHQQGLSPAASSGRALPPTPEPFGQPASGEDVAGASTGSAQGATATTTATPMFTPRIGVGAQSESSAGTGVRPLRGGGNGTTGNAKKDAVARAVDAADALDRALAYGKAVYAAQDRARGSLDDARNAVREADDAIARLEREDAVIVRDGKARGPGKDKSTRAKLDENARQRDEWSKKKSAAQAVIAATPIFSGGALAAVDAFASKAADDAADAIAAVRKLDPTGANARIEKEKARRAKEQLQVDRAQAQSVRFDALNEVQRDIQSSREVARVELEHDHAISKAAGRPGDQYLGRIASYYDERAMHAARATQIEGLDEREAFLKELAQYGVIRPDESKELAKLRADESRRRAEAIRNAKRDLANAKALAKSIEKLIAKLLRQGKPDWGMINGLESDLEALKGVGGVIDLAKKDLDKASGKVAKKAPPAAQPKPPIAALGTPKAGSGDSPKQSHAAVSDVPEAWITPPGSSVDFAIDWDRLLGSRVQFPGQSASESTSVTIEPPQINLLEGAPCPSEAEKCKLMICPIGTKCSCRIEPAPPVTPPPNGGGGSSKPGGSGTKGDPNLNPSTGGGGGKAPLSPEGGAGGGGYAPPKPTAPPPVVPPGSPPETGTSNGKDSRGGDPTRATAGVPPDTKTRSRARPGDGPGSDGDQRPPDPSPYRVGSTDTPTRERTTERPTAAPEGTHDDQDTTKEGPCAQALGALRRAELPKLGEEIRNAVEAALAGQVGGQSSPLSSEGAALHQRARRYLIAAESWVQYAIKKLVDGASSLYSVFCKAEDAAEYLERLARIRLALLALRRAALVFATELTFNPPDRAKSAWDVLPMGVISLAGMAIVQAKIVAGALDDADRVDRFGKLVTDPSEWAHLQELAAVESAIDTEYAVVGPDSWAPILKRIEAEWAIESEIGELQQRNELIFGTWDAIINVLAGYAPTSPIEHSGRLDLKPLWPEGKLPPWLEGNPWRAEREIGSDPTRSGWLTMAEGESRLHPDEIATGARLAQKLGIDLWESPHAGAEFVDALNRTYDACGVPAASKFWNEAKFLRSIDGHLLKSNHFTVLDLTGFTNAQKATVRAYIDGLPAASQARIIRIGF